MNRKLLLFFLAAVLLVFAVHAADAATVRLDALGMRIDVPVEYSMFTRDTPLDDPALEANGLDGAELIQRMKDSGVYLELLSDDPALEALVTMQTNAVENMNIFDEGDLEQLKGSLTQEYENAGMAVSSIDCLAAEQTVFFRTEGSLGDTQVLVYYTIYDHKAISIVLRYEGDAIPARCRTQMQAMVDSVRFDGAAGQSENIPEAEAEADAAAGAEEIALYASFDFEDDEHGVRFTVPEGWAEIPAEYLGVDGVVAAFSSAENHDAAIYYEWNDLLTAVPELSEMLGGIPGFDRIDLNQDSFNIDDIASGIPGDVTDTRVETFGDREYYVFDINHENNARETLAVRIENGYAYNFGFVRIDGADCDAQYPDFVALVKSAELPEAEASAPLIAPAGEEPEQPEDPAPEKKKGIPILPIVLGGGAVAGIAGFAVSRNKKKRAAQQQINAAPIAPEPDSPAAYAVPAAAAGAAAAFAQPIKPAAPAATAKRECAACGAGLSPDETVCPYCGTKAE